MYCYDCTGGCVDNEAWIESRNVWQYHRFGDQIKSCINIKYSRREKKGLSKK